MVVISLSARRRRALHLRVINTCNLVERTRERLILPMARKKKTKAEEVLEEKDEALLDAEELEDKEEPKGITGRPPSIASPEEMEKRIVEYLNSIPRWGLPTKAGLSFALGCHRDTLNKYEKEPIFSDILKHWYPYFEDRWVQNLARPNATGTIFYLKNTYQYRDTMDVNPQGLTINFILPQEISGKYIQPPSPVEAPKPVEAKVIENPTPHEVPPSTITSS